MQAAQSGHAIEESATRTGIGGHHE
jgi:hypothetical protein